MILKKRQLLLATLVIALGAAVFINRYYTEPQVNSAVNGVTQAPTLQSTDKGANLGDARYVISTDVTLDDAAAQAVASEYFSGAKLRRQTARDEAAEALNDIIKDDDSSPEAVAKATDALSDITKSITLESDIENLISAKIGCENLVIINGGVAEIIVENGSLDDTSVVQIKEIVVKHTGLPTEKITLIEMEY